MDTILGLVKARLNRMADDTSLDEYLTARINAAISELNAQGILLDIFAPDDAVLVCDYVVNQYQNRDKNESMPDWLRLRIRQRWLRERR